MIVTLYYNYYIDPRDDRRAEIDACLARAANTPEIDRIVVLAEPGTPLPIRRAELVQVAGRPTFQEFFNIVDARSTDDDINIIINSDCFLDPRDIKKLRGIRDNEAYCIRRRDLLTANPIKIDQRRTHERLRQYPDDSQDCWVIKGRSRRPMTIGFPMGKPGCDNRLAHELKNVGYRIADPYYYVRLYHYHRERGRGYSACDRVPGPYAYPKKLYSSSIVTRLFHRTREQYYFSLDQRVLVARSRLKKVILWPMKFVAGLQFTQPQTASVKDSHSFSEEN